jgi:hypothetical protein
LKFLQQVFVAMIAIFLGMFFATLLAIYIEDTAAGGTSKAPPVPFCYMNSDGLYHQCDDFPTAQDWVDWGRDV